MKRPICTSCAYYEMMEPREEEDGPHGECRRHAPRSVPGGVTGSDTEVFFPQVFRDHWCGEHHDFPAYLESLKQEKEAR